MQDKILICICGKSGSGKSTLAYELCKKYSCEVLDIDKIAHKVIALPSIIKKLTSSFGNDILIDNNKIDRKKLGKIVFSDKSKNNLLNEITWPKMDKLIAETINQSASKIIVLDYIHLPLTHYFTESDLRILVKLDDNTRLERLIKRDNVSKKYIQMRDKYVVDFSKYNFDFVINNQTTTTMKIGLNKVSNTIDCMLCHTK